MPVWRGFSFLVVASRFEGERLFAVGLSRVEPFRVGDRFRWMGPAASPRKSARPCSLEIRSILRGDVYVTWTDAGTTVELELIGISEALPEGTELSGDYSEPLGPYRALARGRPRVFG